MISSASRPPMIPYKIPEYMVYVTSANNIVYIKLPLDVQTDESYQWQMFGGYLKLQIVAGATPFQTNDTIDPIYVYMQGAEGIRDSQGKATETIGKLEYYDRYQDLSGKVYMIFRQASEFAFHIPRLIKDLQVTLKRIDNVTQQPVDLLLKNNNPQPQDNDLISLQIRGDKDQFEI